MGWRRWALVVAGAVAVPLVAVGGPVATVEIACRADTVEPATARPSILGQIGRAADIRPEAQSYLTYPEWYIVYAYDDFARQIDRGGESGVRYLASIGQFWSGFCGVNRLVDGRGQSSVDTKLMLYTIGLSFTAELGIKGAYETTIGRLFEAIRGPERTPEDRLAQAMARDYVAFLQQQPWYEYPFGDRVGDLWRIPSTEPTSSRLRSRERRVALTMEWGAKAGYAWAIKRANDSAFEAEDRDIVSVLSLPPGEALDPRAEALRDLGNGRVLARSPRYQALTDILTGLARKGGTPVEIAGNTRGLTTILVPDAMKPEQVPARVLFAGPILSRPGWRRVGIDVDLETFGDVVRAVEAGGGTIEHFYDY